MTSVRARSDRARRPDETHDEWVTRIGPPPEAIRRRVEEILRRARRDPAQAA